MGSAVQNGDDRLFAWQERLLAQHALKEVPPCVGVEGNGYFGGDVPVGGRSIRLSVRDGMDLLAHDVQILEDAEQGVSSDPCLAVTLLLDGAGKGFVSDPASDAGPEVLIDYISSTLYVSFSTRPLGGRSSAPAGSRYRLVELRLSHAFLKRLGMWAMLTGLGVNHPLHRASGEGYWIGASPAPAALITLAELIHTAALGGVSSDLALDARGLDFLAAALELLGNRDQMAATALPGRSRKRVAAAAQMLRAEPAHPWSIRELARAAGLGDKTLKLGFREYFDMTVMGYLKDARLELGRRLLKEGADSVTEVSLKVGYANPSHFARLYRLRFGEAPSTARFRA